MFDVIYASLEGNGRTKAISTPLSIIYIYIYMYCFVVNSHARDEVVMVCFNWRVTHVVWVAIFGYVDVGRVACIAKPKQAQLISTRPTVKNNNRTQERTQQSFTTMRNQPNMVKRNGVIELSNPQIQRSTQSWLNTLQ